MKTEKELEFWSEGFKHGYLASGVEGAERRVKTVMRALDDMWESGRKAGLGARRAALDDRMKTAAEAARQGKLPNVTPKPSIPFASALFHTRVTMAATASTVEKWDNTAARGTVMIELCQADINNPKVVGARVAVGESFCDPTDKWNAAVGLKLAWSRLIKDLCKNRPSFRGFKAYQWRFGARNVVDQFTKITTVGGDPVKMTLELSQIAARCANTARYYKAAR